MSHITPQTDGEFSFDTCAGGVTFETLPVETRPRGTGGNLDVRARVRIAAIEDAESLDCRVNVTLAYYNADPETVPMPVEMIQATKRDYDLAIDGAQLGTILTSKWAECGVQPLGHHHYTSTLRMVGGAEGQAGSDTILDQICE